MAGCCEKHCSYTILSHPDVDLTVSKGLALSKEDYFTLLSEQSKHMKIFSDLVIKAQSLVKHISEDLKICSGCQSHSKGNFTKIVEVFNVSTQIGLGDSQESLNKPSSSKQSKNKEKPKAANSKERCDRTNQVEGVILSVASSGELFSKNINIENVTSDDKLIKYSETNGVRSFVEMKNNDGQSEHKDVETIDLKSIFESSEEEIDTQSNISNADEVQTKLSLHALPPVAIRRELVTQKIPDVVIHPEESVPQTEYNQNVGYEIICSTTTGKIMTHLDSPDLVYSKIDNIVDQVLKDINKNSSENMIQIISDDTNGINRTKTCLIEPSVLKVKPTNIQVLEATVAQKIANACKYLAKSQKEEISKKIMEEILKDPVALSMYKSYQVIEENRVPSCEAEVDEDLLSFIDNDVYKTYVNPDGFKNVNYTDKSTVGTKFKSDPLEPFYQNKAVQVDGTFHENEDATWSSIDRRHSSAIAFQHENNITQPLTNLLSHSSLSETPTFNLNQKDCSEFMDMYNLVPSELCHKEPHLKNACKNLKTGDIQNKPLFSNFNRNATKEPAKTNTLPRDRYILGASLEHRIGYEKKKSEESLANLSTATEDIILSIDSIALRKTSCTGIGEARTNLNDTTNSSKKPELFESGSKKEAPHHALKGPLKKSITSEEFIITPDMRINISSSRTEPVERKSSKESSSTPNTDDSLKLINLLETPLTSTGELTCCCGCTRFCFPKLKKGNEINVKEEPKPVLRKSSLSGPRDKRLNEGKEGSISPSDIIQQRRSVKIEEPLSDSYRLPRQEYDQNMESFIKELTNCQNTIGITVPVTVTPTNYSTLHANYSNSDVLRFINKVSEELDDTKKKYMLMPISIERPTFLLDNCECKKYNRGNECTHFNSSLGSIDDSCPMTVLGSKEYRDIFIKNTGKLQPLEEDTHSEGELKGQCDCSIGEIHSCSIPESVFMKEIQISRQKILNKKIRNSNWVTYYVSSDSTSYFDNSGEHYFT